MRTGLAINAMSHTLVLEEAMTTTTNGKSGKGLSDGVISELATYFDVVPGHENELRAASERFTERVRSFSATDPDRAIRTGLRDTRLVIFDDGKRLLWATTFETEWDPYIDDAILAVGIRYFLDWMQHTTQGQKIMEWADSYGGAAKLDAMPEESVRKATVRLKEILQSVQSPAVAYFNVFNAWTMSQVFKALRLQEAFQQVLDDPAAEQALQHPALKPLLELAAD